MAGSPTTTRIRRRRGMRARATPTARRARTRTRCRASRSSRRTTGSTSRASTSCGPSAASTLACPAACTCTSAKARSWSCCTLPPPRSMSPEPVEGPAKARSARGFADAGARIDTLLNALSAGGPLARERAEELVRVVTDLYGAGLEQLLTLLYERGRLDAEILEALATDDLVSNL